MRRILHGFCFALTLFGLTCLPTLELRAAASRVNATNGGTEGSTTNTITAAAFNATAGNTIVACVRKNLFAVAPTLTDTAGNTYNLKASNSGGSVFMYIYAAENITGNASNVVQAEELSGADSYWWIQTAEYTGVATSSYDAAGANNGSATTDLTTTAITTTTAGVVVVCGSVAAASDFTAGTDFDLVDGTIYDGGGIDFGGMEQRITTGTLSSYTAHITSSASAAYTTAWIALKEGSGSPAVAPRFMTLGVGQR